MLSDWWPPPIVVTPEYVEHRRHLFKKKRLYWNEITGIVGSKQDMFTYDALFLTLWSGEDKGMVFGELDKGFKELERMILEKFSGFPTNWMEELEKHSANYYQTLWTK
jgi:hypothetical protein